ncbi:prolyl aminopeptidase [Leptolyngbya sp. 15MV]|nr:prolyl aminopeptidase [Leptolyngbya sp. 15MV]
MLITRHKGLSAHRDLVMLHPLTEPLASGLLKVDDRTEIYWETSGNPSGKPALFLHGGPGSGLRSGSYRQLFDPQRYRLVSLDQRGCGRSRPLVTDDLTGLARNNTQALISDVEKLRQHLGIERWLVAGTSWGATLALALAQAHPERVEALVLMAVTTTSRAEVDWITEGVGRFFPEEWDVFRMSARHVPGERLVEAYARRLASDDADDRREAAQAWRRWESTHVSLDPDHSPADEPADEAPAMVFATLVSHYWANDGFLRDGSAILDRMALIEHMPSVLIHGRRDIGSPPVTAWKLHRSWAASRLVIVEDEGHGGPGCRQRMRAALDRFR